MSVKPGVNVLLFDFLWVKLGTCLQVDSDGDGYLSCFEVLLALKEIIPPELLTEEEEIYVYRVLKSISSKLMQNAKIFSFPSE